MGYLSTYQNECDCQGGVEGWEWGAGGRERDQGSVGHFMEIFHPHPWPFFCQIIYL